ncbi:hypothetical protein HC251_23650 [Iamia sp. SCSIO 61187]|uniref:hypothetical protein n=1 Tax=Iamia sp. SCSIO 61187 TaxID=2722752 RepID=UPI001C6248EB|nr:hypothetical protein [Iamia sp. SCSIO 61187]QYG95126.1 hypothetical protein HC251_23650 [Iamia sp. SCSIO 61187]
MTLLRRVALVVILAGSLVVGLWAQVFPRSFYDDFPGAGRVWVAVDGPFNEHLVRDVGGLNLGLAFVAGFALVTGSVLVARAAGGAALLFGGPHLLYHSLHLDPFDTTDVVGLLVALTAAALAGLLALAAPAPVVEPAHPEGRTGVGPSVA